MKRTILLTALILFFAAHSSSAEDTTPPEPNVMTWAKLPKVTGQHSIIMTATTASDPNGVEYYFNNVTDPTHDSDWQDDVVYEDTGLSGNTWYTYKVKARDKSPNQNETEYSSPATERTAATWGVPWPSFTRIQYAIDSSQCRDGDTILVRSGITSPIVYSEDGNRDIDFRGKAVTVRSVAGAGLTVIDCSGSPTDPHRGFYFDSGEDANSVVRGFTITGGYVEYDVGAAVYCESSSPTITNCVIRDNEAYTDDPGQDPTYGGAIECLYGASPTITDCNIFGNSATRGGAIDCYDSSSPIIRNCLITSNWAVGSGGGIQLEGSCSPIIENCLISGNIANVGGGIICFLDCSPTITNCVIAGNEASIYGGGAIDCTESSPVITNCTISSNYANGAKDEYNRNTGGGGVNCEPDLLPSSPTITNCIFENNTKHGVYEYDVSCDPNVRYCLFASNPDGDYWDEDANSLTGAESINSIADGFAHDNIDGEPLFVMDGPNGITGTLTDSPAYPDYNPTTNRTTLYDANATFIAEQLIGKIINLNTEQRRQVLITDNTTTTIEVVGDVTDYMSNDGETYKIIDYHLQSSSPCIDTGTEELAPTTDMDDLPRPVNILGRPPVTGDLNNDGIVNLVDLATLIKYWLNDNCTPPELCEGADIAPPAEPDGEVDFLDFALMAAHIYLGEAATVFDIGAYELQM